MGSLIGRCQLGSSGRTRPLHRGRGGADGGNRDVDYDLRQAHQRAALAANSFPPVAVAAELERNVAYVFEVPGRPPLDDWIMVEPGLPAVRRSVSGWQRERQPDRPKPIRLVWPFPLADAGAHLDPLQAVIGRTSHWRHSEPAPIGELNAEDRRQ